LLAITAQGYATCWTDGATRLNGVCEKIAGLLAIGDGKSVRCVLPVGVPAEKHSQPPRKSFEERVDWRR
ncbi:MAG: nitroreductase, partial [Defluviitaleaceae bacterium]|nr:nitroreductase [Defluviitaleaceae bacterium]